MLKAYYAKQDAEKASSGGDTVQKSTLMKSGADALKKSADALNNDELWEKKKIKKKDEKTGEEVEVEDYDWDAITKAVKSFVEDYNDVVEQAGDSNSKDVLRNAVWMTGITESNENMLSKIGITVGKGNKLELDEEALKKADISSFKTLFTGHNSEKEKTKNTTTAKESKINTDEYVRKLQKQVKDLSLEVGTGLNTKKDNMVGAVTINPKLLEKMQNDPKAEREYTQMLQGIQRAESIVGSYYNSIGNVVERTSHWYMDENGNLVSFGHVRIENKLDKELRKQADENAKKLIEKTREKAKEKAEELQERLDSIKEAKADKSAESKAEKILSEKFSNAVDGELYLNETDMKPILQTIRAEEQEKTKSEPGVGMNLDLKI